MPTQSSIDTAPVYGLRLEYHGAMEPAIFHNGVSCNMRIQLYGCYDGVPTGLRIDGPQSIMDCMAQGVQDHEIATLFLQCGITDTATTTWTNIQLSELGQYLNDGGQIKAMSYKLVLKEMVAPTTDLRDHCLPYVPSHKPARFLVHSRIRRCITMDQVTALAKDYQNACDGLPLSRCVPLNRDGWNADKTFWSWDMSNGFLRVDGMYEKDNDRIIV